MSKEEKPELGKVFKRLTKKAIDVSLKVSQRAVEEGVKTAKTLVEKAPVKPPTMKTPDTAGGEGVPAKARPFTPRTARPGKRVYWDPLENREFPILEYDAPPRVDPESISGLSKAAVEIARLVEQGSRRILIVGPPGVGKAVLALGAVYKAGLPLFDVDSLGLRKLGGDAREYLEELFARAADEGRAIVFYNIEWIASPPRFSKIVIYDPWENWLRGEPGVERVIIYDPYTPLVEEDTGVEEDVLHKRFMELLDEYQEKIPLIVATTSKLWALPPRLRKAFDRITVGFPGFEERLEIIKTLDPKIPDERARLLAAATQGFGFRSLKALLEKLGGDYSIEAIERALHAVKGESLTLASAFYNV